MPKQKRKPLQIDYAKMADEEVVARVQEQKDTAAQNYLLQKYKSFVWAKGKSYFLIGAEKEDIIQEGMIGLFKAIRDFRNEKLASFKAFAELCITRQIITAIKTATRQKHIPLNSYISLNKPVYQDEESERTLLDMVSSLKVVNPENMLINKEEFTDVEKEMNKVLSDLEWQVLRSYIDGKSYQEIAKDLGRHVKSVDNALQRVKRKMEKFFAARGETTNLQNIYDGLIALSARDRFPTHEDK